MTNVGTETFQYKHLAPKQMRVLRILDGSTSTDIRCRLTTLTLPEKEGSYYGFRALSYCWGEPSPVANITINEKSFGVARNLLTFLR